MGNEMIFKGHSRSSAISSFVRSLGLPIRDRTKNSWNGCEDRWRWHW